MLVEVAPYWSAEGFSLSCQFTMLDRPAERAIGLFIFTCSHQCIFASLVFFNSVPSLSPFYRHAPRIEGAMP